MVVVDESSSFKNHTAKRFKSLAYMHNHIKRMVLLTGTPAPNGLIDLWAQVYLLDRGESLGKTYTGFRDYYFEPDQRSREMVYSYKPKSDSNDSIMTAISGLCISMKADDYLELPPVINSNTDVRSISS